MWHLLEPLNIVKISQHCTVVQSTVVWAVRLSIGNKRISTPCRTKTRKPINTKFGRGDQVGEHIRSAKNIWGSVERWRPHAMTVCQTFCDFALPFSPVQPTGQTRLSPMTYYASNDVVPLIHVPFGVKSQHFTFWGPPATKTANIFPQTGKSHLNLKCLITFKR